MSFLKMSVMRVKKLDSKAQLPVKGTDLSAGYDLTSVKDVTIKPGERELIPTGLAIEIVPFGYYGRIAPRSGLAFKNGIDVMAGVIDADYRKEVGVILINHSKEDFKVKTGDRVAQIILTAYTSGEVEEVKGSLSELKSTTTQRTGGFGSTGMQALAPKEPYNKNIIYGIVILFILFEVVLLSFNGLYF